VFSAIRHFPGCAVCPPTRQAACVSSAQPQTAIQDHKHTVVILKCAGRRGVMQPAAATAAAATATATATAAAGTLRHDSLLSSYLNDSRATAAAAKPMPPLPAAPSSFSLWGVLLYLSQLAMAEKQMLWRIGAAFTCILLSKVGAWC
jgi:hypothetical protein